MEERKEGWERGRKERRWNSSPLSVAGINTTTKSLGWKGLFGLYFYVKGH